MGLLSKLKSLFGSDSQGQTGTESPQADPRTVEREPSAASEHAVKGTDEAGVSQTGTVESTEQADSAGTTEEPTAEDEMTAEDETTASADTAEPAEDGAASASVEEIKGIGPTYAERLEVAGIESVADLAAADVDAVAEAAEATDTRATDWVERAQEY